MSPKNPLQLNPTHYYLDGNVILCAGTQHFRVHGSILCHSSAFFAGLLRGSWNDAAPSIPCEHDEPKKSETDSVVAKVQLRGKDPKEVELLLSTLYLHTELEITWHNVEPILKLADEYEFPRIMAKCDQLLRKDMGDKPLEVLILADRYRLPEAYKASSALVLHDYAKISRRHEYKQLSLETRVELQAVRLRYLDGIEELSQQNGWDTITNTNCRAYHLQMFQTQRKSGTSLTTLSASENFQGCNSCNQETCNQQKIQRTKDALGMSNSAITVGDKKYFLFIELAAGGGERSSHTARSKSCSASIDKDDRFDVFSERGKKIE
ncbi:hypothetical protein BC936DRAFT_139516 [Jimgerdemannia flammicorona]|uniref:BTB domain-containing protein n=1 Tax=Jimgerdemannia flammicorona TaxID=994334 RepID=A0A433B9R9_9FUNG|nr:hypothetical protein BC936DRAFT_139516 [Jimgerdemannia flammicorona]